MFLGYCHVVLVGAFESSKHVLDGSDLLGKFPPKIYKDATLKYGSSKTCLEGSDAATRTT